MKRTLPIVMVVSMMLSLCACNSTSQNTQKVSVSEAYYAPTEQEMEDGDYRLSAGDIILVSSAVDDEDFAGGGQCAFRYVIENKSGHTLYNLGLTCKFISDDNTILGTTIAYLNSAVDNGQKATLEGSFDADDFGDAALIQADTITYDCNNDHVVYELGFLDEDVEKTTIDLLKLSTPTPALTNTPEEKAAAQPNVDGGTFTFSADDFRWLMVGNLAGRYTSGAGTTSDGSYGVAVGNVNRDVLCKIFFLIGEDFVQDEQTTGIETITLGFPSETDEEDVIGIMDAVIASCDPSLSASERKNLEAAIVQNGMEDTADVPSGTANLHGIQYNLVLFADSWYMSIMPTDEEDTDIASIAEPEKGEDSSAADGATMGERNALSTAKSYLNSIAFSYSGLIDQLEYEGYSHEEAVYGADNCGADWYEQAAKSAESYLNTMSFSRSGLIEQLEYEGFTHDQAVYGAEQNGY